MKRKFSLFDLIVALIFSFLLCFFVLPTGLKYFLTKDTSIPRKIKMEILSAGKKYIDNNSVNYVSLNELYSSGYLIKKDEISELNCFDAITVIQKTNNKYSLRLECEEERTTLSLLE